jgi:hypothetical protein
VLDTIFSDGITAGTLLICLAAALVLGLGTAAIHMFRNHYSKSFVVTLVLLPAIVALVIMMVNGNIGAGVAWRGPSASSASVRYPGMPGKSAASFSPWPSDSFWAWDTSLSRFCFSWL